LRGFERTVELDPDFVNGWTNQADIHTSIAERDVARGVDPRPAVARAVHAGQQGLEIDPNYYSLLATMAQAELAGASYLVGHGGDPMTTLARTRGYLDKAIAVQPGNMAPWYYRVIAAEVEAQFRLRMGSNASSPIATGRAALRETLRIDPGAAVSHVEAARLGLIEATSVARTSRAAVLRRDALVEIERAIALNPRAAAARLVAAEVCLQITTALRSRPITDRGIEYVDQALALHPGLPGAQAVRSALLQPWAR
jgi:tetratricopeptide (TPR) repeat protein